MHPSRTRSVPPPRSARPGSPVLLSQLWTALPIESQRKVLRALSRAMARELEPAPNPREVPHEHP